MIKRILIRAGFNPTKEYKPYLFFDNSLVGDNVGNLLFAYGAMNVLWTEETSIDHIYDKAYYSEQEINYINSNFDVFVMPMADAFRSTYVKQLLSFTNLIQNLKIPVVVLGIGYRTTYEPQFDKDQELNKVVKKFVETVLDHSNKLGLRGEITGSYLKKLGFKEDRDFIPIGCPSLYTYGDNIQIRDISLSEIYKGKLLFNSNTWAQHHFPKYIPYINRFILKVVSEIPNHFLIQQKIQELKCIYWGNYYSSKVQIESIQPEEVFRKMQQEDRVKCFINVPSWIQFCHDANLFVGNRFHGAVAAILAGSPHIFLPFDGRTRELSEFHHLSSLSPYELMIEKSIYDYMLNLDFYSFDRYHEKNFNNYLDFLKQNGLQHIFYRKKGVIFGESPMEKQINYSSNSISCMDSLSLSQKIVRVTSSLPYFIKKLKS